MSDTKILSGEQVRNVFRMGSDISMVQVCESHFAQEQRIAELEQANLDLQTECQMQQAARTTHCAGDAAILRAEAAEAQVKAMLEALPPKMAGDIADILLEYCESNRQLAHRLYAYAAAAKPKEG